MRAVACLVTYDERDTIAWMIEHVLAQDAGQLHDDFVNYFLVVREVCRNDMNRPHSAIFSQHCPVAVADDASGSLLPDYLGAVGRGPFGVACPPGQLQHPQAGNEQSKNQAHCDGHYL